MGNRRPGNGGRGSEGEWYPRGVARWTGEHQLVLPYHFTLSNRQGEVPWSDTRRVTASLRDIYSTGKEEGFFCSLLDEYARFTQRVTI
ncbi:hypothetical protein E2C01_070325 [Portunus trituberculatus]|uniref:Uncharacterized protein n=1 Tax=Portunus trituberculatus TaxID=210409 RepID=A0A5B7I1A4_PORTR|nr:hypothetical protein [Portunus trituberculatus]